MNVKQNIPPSNDAYPIIAALFTDKHFSKHEINVNSLSITILELIKNNQIKCEIPKPQSHKIGKKINENDMEIMKNITFRISRNGELKTSQTSAMNLLKTMNKTKKFTLKDMFKKSNNAHIANRFKTDFNEFKKSVEKENNYTSKNYRNFLENGRYTKKGKEIKKEWKNYKNYLKSKELTEKYPPKYGDENLSQLIYGACFNIEKETLAIRENNTPLSNFIDIDGYKMLNTIFKNTLSNASEKKKGDGIFYDINDKYTIPGGG